MGKLDDFSLKGLQRGRIAELIEFKEQVRELLNYGKESFPVVTAVPAWNAGEGEMAFFNQVSPQTDRRIYVRLYSSWVVFSQIIGTGSGPGASPGGPDRSIQINSQGVFSGTGNFLYFSESSQLIVSNASNGPISFLLLANTQDYVSLANSSNIALDFGFIGTDSQIARILAGKVSDYTITNAKDSFMKFITEKDDILQTQLTLGGNVGVSFANFGGGRFPTSAGVEIEGNLLVGSNAALSGFATPANGIYSEGPIYINALGVSPVAGAVLYLKGTATASAMALQLEGPTNTSTPCLIDFGHTASQDNFRIQYDRNISDGIMRLVLFHVANTVGCITIRDVDNTLSSQEDPAFIVEAQTLGMSSGSVIANQRQIQFLAPTITALSNMTVTNAATVFIDAAPFQAGSATLTNKYALWISGGTLRVDGPIISNNVVTYATSAKASGVFFTTSSSHVSSNSTTENELIRAIVGTTSLVANTLSEGRTIRLSAMGYYNSPATPGTMIMNVKLGGATILSTSNQTVTGNASTFGWSLESLLTCQTTGGAGTIFGQGRFDNNSSATAMNRWQMVGSSTVTLNTTGANIVELTCQWGTANAASQLFCTNAIGELLN